MEATSNYAAREYREDATELCDRLVNDYEHITFGSTRRTLQPRDTLRFQVASRRRLATRLASGHDGPTGVVTHHAPLLREQLRDPVERALAGALASDLTAMMGAEQPICGSSLTRTSPQTSMSPARGWSATRAATRTSR